MEFSKIKTDNLIEIYKQIADFIKLLNKEKENTQKQNEEGE